MWWKKERKININIILIVITIGLLIYGLSKMERKVELNNFFEGEINVFCINDGCVERDGEKWRYKIANTKKPASKDMVESYLKKFTALQIGQVVSTNKEKELVYGFDDKRVELMINNKSLLIGGIDESYSGTFVKTTGSDDVRLANVVLDRNVLSNEKSFEDNTITNWPKDKINKIEATNGEKKTTLNVKDKPFIDLISNLNGIGYIDSIDKSKAKAIKIVVNEGEYSLIIGQVDKIYFASSDEQNYFEIMPKDYFALRSKIR